MVRTQTKLKVGPFHPSLPVVVNHTSLLLRFVPQNGWLCRIIATPSVVQNGAAT
jgi:hypothetical protein